MWYVYLLCKLFQQAFYCTDRYYKGQRGHSTSLWWKVRIHSIAVFWHYNICFPYACTGWKHRTSMSNPLKAGPWEEGNWKEVRIRRGWTLNSDTVLSCTVSLSLPTPGCVTHWCHFSDKAHSSHSPGITLFLVLHRCWSPPCGSPVLAFQTWHQRETCSGFRLTVLTRQLCRSSGASPGSLQGHTTSPSPVWLQMSPANQINIFLNCSRKFRKHKFLKLTAVAFT